VIYFVENLDFKLIQLFGIKIDNSSSKSVNAITKEDGKYYFFFKNSIMPRRPHCNVLIFFSKILNLMKFIYIQRLAPFDQLSNSYLKPICSKHNTKLIDFKYIKEMN